MLSAFQTVLQSYYAPVVALMIFTGLLAVDQLLSWQEKRLFFLELAVVGSLLLITWIDRCASTVREGEVFWRVRFLTSVLQFSLGPLSPLLLGLLYRPGHRAPNMRLFCLPAVVNFLLTVTSLWTGLVIHVAPGNLYSRGPLFPLPLLASAFYLFNTARFISWNESPGRRMESTTMIWIIVAVAGANACEISMGLHNILWSTTTACLVLCFLVMTTKKVLYDPLTGVYSRLAYHKRLGTLQGGRRATLAMVDINGLKAVNDTLGHAAGDKAILQTAQALLAIRLKGLKLYRYGGDEFVLVCDGCAAHRLEEELEQALDRCGAVESVPLSFAYGIKEYAGSGLHALLEEMDQEMYQRKQAMKQRKAGPP